MAFFLIQQWWVTPGPFNGNQVVDGGWHFVHMSPAQPGNRGLAQARVEDNEAASSPSYVPSGLDTSQPMSVQLREGGDAQNNSPHGQNVVSGPSPNEGSFAMGSMAASLPNYRPAGQPFPMAQGGQRFPSGAMSGMAIQQQQMPQFAGQTAMNAGHNPNFPAQYAHSFQQMQQTGLPSPGYIINQPSHQHPGGGMPAPLQQSFQGGPFYPSQQQQPQQYFAYPGGFGQINPSQNFSGPQRQMPGTIPGNTGRIQQGGMMGASYGSQTYDRNGSSLRSGTGPASRPNAAPAQGPIPSTPRGPPRKPKQSGHALWVGNLPVGAQVQELKDHFSKGATEDIDSVFLISKSNCAFVNYRTEEACAAAMTRFHDSRFQGVRLVCRLRRNSAAPSPATSSSQSVPFAGTSQAQTAVEAITQNREVSMRAEESMRQAEGAAKINDKYFIVKSLTVEDLELSARNGIWATQAHNEEALNKAFESVDCVYLIFSANKSGEYFGYARMTSRMGDENAVEANWTPQAEAAAPADDADLPRSISTPATDTAPKGRIIDDSARGTIFWEADRSDQLESPLTSGDVAVDGEEPDGAGGDEDVGVTEEPSMPQAYGKPFKIEWISTNRLPFYRTRGLRNPWNANRDVKIARDGTELETSVGRRLVQMFHRPSPGPGGQQFNFPGAGGHVGYSNAPPP